MVTAQIQIWSYRVGYIGRNVTNAQNCIKSDEKRLLGGSSNETREERAKWETMMFLNALVGLESAVFGSPKIIWLRRR